MDARSYLKSYGWTEGEALSRGGLRKPLLVQHKRDTKGLGHDKDKDGETWWESLFDGHLKNLEVNSGSKGVQFSIDEQKVDSTIRKKNSPLYRMFIQGEGLAGTVGKTNFEVKTKKFDAQEVFEKQVKGGRVEGEETGLGKEVEVEKKEKKEKEKKGKSKDKKEKKEKGKSKDKKEKKDKKDKKKDKEEKKDKKGKDKKDKKKDKEEKKDKKGKDSKDKKVKTDTKDKKDKNGSKDSKDKDSKSRKRHRDDTSGSKSKKSKL